MSILYLGFTYFLDIFKRPCKNLGIIFNILSVTISLAFSIFIISIFRGMSDNTLYKISEIDGDLHFQDLNSINLDKEVKEVYKIDQSICFLMNNFATPIKFKKISKEGLEQIFSRYMSINHTDKSDMAVLSVYVGEDFIRKNKIDISKPFAVCFISKSWEIEIVVCQICGTIKTGLAYFDEMTILTTSELPEDLIGCTYYSCYLNELHKSKIDKWKKEGCVTWKMLFSEIYEVFNLCLNLTFLILTIFFSVCAIQIFTVIFQIIHNNSLNIFILHQLGTTSYQRWKIFAFFCFMLAIFIILTSNAIAIFLISVYNACDKFLIRIFNINTIGISSIKAKLLMLDLIFIDIFALLIILAFCSIALRRRT